MSILPTGFRALSNWRYFLPNITVRGGAAVLPSLIKGYRNFDGAKEIAHDLAVAVGNGEGSPRDFGAIWRRAIAQDAKATLSRVADQSRKVVLPYAQTLLEKELGADRSSWKRGIITFDASTPDGHCYVTVSYEAPSLTGVEAPSYRTGRFLVGGFFGQGFGVPPDVVRIYADTLSKKGPESAARLLRVAAPDIARFNSDQFNKNMPMDGVFQVGYSSDVVLAGHEISESTAGVHTGALASTTAQHTMDGDVYWSHHDTPEGRWLVQTGVGQHPFPGGNALNTRSAGPTFKFCHDMGTRMQDMYPKIEKDFGQKEAGKLRLGNPMYWSLVEDAVKRGDYYLLVNEAVLGLADATGGRFLALERAPIPKQAASFPLDEYTQLDAQTVSERVAQLAEQQGEKPPGSLAELPKLPAEGAPLTWSGSDPYKPADPVEPARPEEPGRGGGGEGREPGRGR